MRDVFWGLQTYAPDGVLGQVAERTLLDWNQIAAGNEQHEVQIVSLLRCEKTSIFEIHAHRHLTHYRSMQEFVFVKCKCFLSEKTSIES